MDRKNILKTAAAMAGSLLLFAACDYDDTLHDTPHPAQGALVLHTDYDRGNYFLRSGDYRTTLEEAKCHCPDLFAPGTYILALYNLPEGMTDHDGILSVDRLPDGTLTPRPGTLYATSTEATVIADDTLHVRQDLLQRTRLLTLRLTATTGNPDLLARIDARLTGLAPALESASMALTGEAAEVKPVFTREGTVLTAPLNLLGTMPGTRQYLTVTLTNRDGQSQTAGYDLTELLAPFNTGTSPLTLDADLLLMTEADFGFTISDWTDGGSEGGDAV